MSAAVKIFHGEDEAGIRAAVNELQATLGDASTYDMNTTRLEGSGISLDALANATQAMPFLSERRLVIVTGAAKQFSAAGARQQFTQILENLPETTTVVLVEIPALETGKSWLTKWAKTAGVNVRIFAPTEEGPMQIWLRERAKQLGGELQLKAAQDLTKLVNSDKTAAENELQKLLAYVNWQRPVEAADVAALCSAYGEQGDFFALIDSLTSGQAGKAMQKLQAIMPERDPILLYFSLVSHFRLLVQVQELVAGGLADAQIAGALNIHPFRAQKMAGQTRRFSRESLKAIYAHLLFLDEKVKTGEMEPELAMETFVAGLSAQVA